MTRWLLVALLTLAVAPAALAQEDEGEEPIDEPVVTATPTPAPDPCDRPAGTDGDYAYCGDPCSRPAGTDGDYAYCPSSGRPGRPIPDGAGRPKAAAQPLAAGTLPVTGSEPLLVALVGLGFLLAGAGLRLRLSAAGPPPSS